MPEIDVGFVDNGELGDFTAMSSTEGVSVTSVIKDYKRHVFQTPTKVSY